jgi:hypothetical protein
MYANAQLTSMLLHHENPSGNIITFAQFKYKDFSLEKQYFR